MGQYINKNSKGESLGSSYTQKIAALIEDGAQRVSGDSYQDNLICVIDNGMFAAAGYMNTEREYKYFSSPEGKGGRPYTWLVHPKAAELVD